MGYLLCDPELVFIDVILQDFSQSAQGADPWDLDVYHMAYF